MAGCKKALSVLLIFSLIFSLFLNVAAPRVQAEEAPTRFNFFDDDKQSGFDYFGWESSQERVTDSVYSGTHALKITFAQNVPGQKMVLTSWGNTRYDVSTQFNHAYLRLAIKAEASLRDSILAEPASRALEVVLEGKKLSDGTDASVKLNLMQDQYLTAADMGQYKLLEIPLADFPGTDFDWSKIGALAFMLSSGTSNVVLHVDDIAIIVKPTPVPSLRYNFFEDDKADSFHFFGWESAEELVTDPVYSGTHALKITYANNTPGQKLVLTSWGTPIYDVSRSFNQAYLRLAIKAEASLRESILAQPNRALEVVLEGKKLSDGTDTSVKLNLMQDPYLTAADMGQYKLLEIPLADFQGTDFDWSKITGLAFMLSSGTTNVVLYVDDIALVTKAAVKSQNANLSSVTLDTYSLTPAFSKSRLTYVVDVREIPASVGVTAVTENNKATVRINGQSAASGSAATVAPDSQNKVNIEVTAEDTAVTKTYVIEFKEIATEPVNITLFKEEQQEIKGWGMYPSYFWRSWDTDPDSIAKGIKYTMFDNDFAHKALYEDSGMNIMRIDLSHKMYDPNESDKLIKTGDMQDTIDHLTIAKEHGISQYFISIWSPPAVMKSTKSQNGQSGTKVSKLLPEYEDAFIEYIANAVKYIQTQGLDLPYGVSFQNEPDFAPKFYEGCVYDKAQYQRVMMKLRNKLDAEGMEEVRVIAGDGANPSSGVTYFGDNFQDLNDPALRESFQTFAYHSYDQHYRSAEDVKKLRAGVLTIPDKDIMMSEWIRHFLNDYNEQTGANLTDEFGTVAFTTQNMLRDLIAVPSEYWVYWIAYYYKNVENPSSDWEHLVVDEEKTKLYHVLSTIWNKAKPGTRVKLMNSDNPNLKGMDTLEDHLIGFSDKVNNKTYLVVVNRHNKNFDASFNYIPGTTATIKRTSVTEDMAPAGEVHIADGTFHVAIPAKSILFIETNAADLAEGAQQPPPISFDGFAPQPSISIPDNTGGYMVVDESTEPVAIDGVLAEEEKWNIYANVSKLVSGVANDSSKFGLKTDRRNLYIGVKVMDPDKVANDEALHNGDAVEIFLNGDGKKDGGYKLNDRQIIVNRNNKIVASNWTGEINGKPQSELLAGVEHKLIEIPGGYSLEMKIPLTLLGVDSKVALGGTTIGLDIAVDDDDIAGDQTLRQGQRVWSGMSNNYENTSFFGTVDLVYAGVPPVIDEENPIVINQPLYQDGTDGLELSGDGQLTELTDHAKVGDKMLYLKRQRRTPGGNDAAPYNRITWKNNEVYSITEEIREHGALSFWYKAKRNPVSQFTSVNLIAEQMIDGVPTVIEASVPLANAVEGVPNETWEYIQIPLKSFPANGSYWDGAKNTSVSIPFDYSRVKGIGISGWMGQENGDLEFWLDEIGFTKVVKKKPLYQVQNLRTTAQTGNSVTLAWDAYAEPGITGIKLFRNNVEIAALSPNTTSYTVAGLNADTVYEFRLRVYGAGGTGPLTLPKIVKLGTPATGGGGYVPGPAPAPQDQLIVNEESLKNGKEGKVSLELADGKKEVLLPAKAAALLKDNKLVVKKGKLTMALDPAVLKELSELLSAEELNDAKISLKLDSVPAADSEALAKKGVAGNGSIKAAGSMYTFELALVAKDGKEFRLSAFSKPIAVSLPYEDGANPELLGVYYFNESSKSWEYVGGKIDKKNKLATVELAHFSTYAVLEYTKAFADVPAEHWVTPALQAMAAKHLVEGRTDTEFVPEGTTTRAEFAALIVRALGLKAKGESGFADVDSGEWYADEVAAAFEAGIVAGKGNGSFAPESSITREEMAAMLVRAYRYAKGDEAKAASAAFQDADQVSDWARAYVESAAKWSLMTGIGNNTFAPMNLTTRDQTVQALYNLLTVIE